MPISAAARLPRIEQYRKAWHALSNESARKEALKDLLRDLYAGDDEARRVLDAMSAGSEYVIRGIPLKDRTKTGRADTQFGSVIIEFEKDLKKTGAHAVEQLQEYLAGNWAAGQTERFTLLITDGLAWEVHAPSYDALLASGVGLARDIPLHRTQALTLTEGNGEDFFLFIERYLFGQVPTKPSLDLVREQFGESSSLFLNALAAMEKHVEAHATDPALTVAFEQWRRFLSLAYGAKFHDDRRVFLVHSYLSVLAKVFAYEVLTGDDFITDDEMAALLDGRFFEQRRVRNFVERDFYGWVSEDVHRRALAPVLRSIAAEVSRYDFARVDEDILKGVYQELVDIETRHSLGEYYTPDWLCDRVVDALDLRPDDTVLDPACGSGSFLRAAVAGLRAADPARPVEQIAAQVAGIDVHPLSVQIAKTTLLLALGADVRRARQPITLRVYLANTLTIPEGSVAGNLFGQDVTVRIDGQDVRLPNALLQDPDLFDAGLRAAEDLATDTAGHADVDAATLANTVRRKVGGLPPPDVTAALLTVYGHFKRAKETGRDSIWHFLLQNVYRPFLLRHQFSVVVGNPPWLTLKDISLRDYQDEVKALASRGGVLPSKKANVTQMELAAVFLTHSATTFLAPGGRLAFVLPRSFFSADQHAATRAGQAEGVKVTALWDLDGVSPLFPVPACVLFATVAHTATKRAFPKSGVPGMSVSGRLKDHNASWSEAAPALTFAEETWHLAEMGRRTAFSTTRQKAGTKTNAYRDLFNNGATLFPRTFFFVTTAEDAPDLSDGGEVYATSLELPEAKAPWKALRLEGRVSTDYLFRTALAQNLLPFALDRTMLVALPVQAQPGGALRMLDADAIQREGERDTAKWFRETERLWDTHRTQKSAAMTLHQRLDFQRNLSKQSLSHDHLVVYSASAKNASAVVIDQRTLDRPFVSENVSYWYGTDDRDEADYLAAFLNADAPNLAIKDFQAKGNFGPRHVHKAILEVPLPRYDASVAAHRALAAAGRACAAEAETWLASALAALRPDRRRPGVGALRSSLRAHLAPRLAEIDALLKRVW